MNAKLTTGIGVFLLLGALAGAGFVYWRGASEATANAPQDKAGKGPPAPLAVPVEAAPVEVGAIVSEVTAVGTLRSNESVVIRSEIAGRIERIGFAEGEPVEKGALLVTLDDSVYQAELQDKQASLNLARRNFDRAAELFSKGAGSERARDEARAGLESSVAAVNLAKARLDKSRIASPFRGILGLRRVSVGDYITPGQDLVNLEDIDPIKVDFRIPERHLGVLKEGQRIRVQVDAYPGAVFEGAVYAVDPQVDASGRSIAIRARLPNKDRRLKPGLFARVTLIIAERENAVLVPEQAIVPRGEQRFVFRVVDGKAALTKVATGQRRAGKVEIVEGLAAGDVVVGAGHLKIRDGAPVTVVPGG
jgi:membrane fusion protein (multidrug efflux system)